MGDEKNIDTENLSPVMELDLLEINFFQLWTNSRHMIGDLGKNQYRIPRQFFENN